MSPFSVRDAGGFGDLFCDFSPAWRCVSRSHAGATGSVVKFMGIFCLTQIPVAIAEGLLTVMIYDQLTKRQVITVQGH